MLSFACKVPFHVYTSSLSVTNCVIFTFFHFHANMYEAARTAGVMSDTDLAAMSSELEGIVAMDAVFEQRWVSRLEGVRVKTETNKFAQAEALMADIERFRTEKECDRLVMVWCASTEAYQEASAVHDTIASFEEGLRNNDDNIAPSQIYAYAALMSGVPFANGAPNLTVDLPCIVELAEREGVPICGKDFKTGQTLMKTLISPGLKSRMLGVRGWYSTNILGNRDGEVLDAPENFMTKEVSKLGVLGTILQPELYPKLYGNIDHKVRIDYYPPRGDDKEVQLDGKTLVSSAVARTGVAVEPQNDYRDTSTNTEKELNLYPETTLDLERRSRTNFYTNTSYTARDTAVKNGFAYAGPRLKTLNTFVVSMAP